MQSSLVREKEDCQNWQLWTSQAARIGNFRQVQSSLIREKEDYQNWQLWTSQIARIGNFGQVRLPELATLDKCSLFYTEIDVKDCQNWHGNFGQVRMPELATLDKSDCQNWQL